MNICGSSPKIKADELVEVAVVEVVLEMVTVETVSVLLDVVLVVMETVVELVEV